VSVAALALAAALLVAPGPPTRRLGLHRPSRPAGRLVVTIAVGVGALSLVAPPTAVAAGAIVVAAAVTRRRGAAARARRDAEAVALQGALGVLVGELRVGVHPVVAFETAAAEVDGPTALALRAVAARARLGADVAAGLLAVARQSGLPGHWERLSVYWRLAQTQGLAIVALMRTAQNDIVERERFASRVMAATAGARATAAILAGLPILGVGMGHLIGADPVRFLLFDRVGGWLLLIGVALACAGLCWSDRIVAGVLK